MNSLPGPGSGGLTAGGIGINYSIGMNAQDIASDVPGNNASVEMDELDLTSVPVCNADWGGRGCRVLGCKEDIYSQRAVNLKYRLCKTHKGAPALLMQGVPKRFCSQCSTFRQLTDFNGRMRACIACLRSRSASRGIKKGTFHTLSNSNHNGSTTTGAIPANGSLISQQQQQQQENAAAMRSSANLENAQIDAIMAGALAEILWNNGKSEPAATTAAIAMGAAIRSASTPSQNHENQQQQVEELAATVYPSPSNILSTTSTAADGAIAADIYTNQNSFESSLSPPTMTTSEMLQQESVMAALLAVVATTSGALACPPAAVFNAREDSLNPYHAFANGSEYPVLPMQSTWQAQPPQQLQQPRQQAPFSMPPPFHSVTPSIPSTQASSIVANWLELKRQRVLAEQHLARTNLELAQIEEDIHRISYKQQQQQEQATVAANGARAPDGVP